MSQYEKSKISDEYDPELADRIKAAIRSDSIGEVKLPTNITTDHAVRLVSQEVKRGGLGHVGRYRDQELGREVAVKFLNPDLAPVHCERFRREIRITSSLDHPGVLPIYSSGEVDGQSFYTMRFVRGSTFADKIEEFHKQPEFSRENPGFRALLEHLKSACFTLGYAHRVKRVWHRDVKPQNIMVDNGLTLVVDWGLASDQRETAVSMKPSTHSNANAGESGLTNAGEYLGSPAYMAPEQALGSVSELDGLTDIYGLGATMFELLTGEAPHRSLPNPSGSTTGNVVRTRTVQSPERNGGLKELLERIAAHPTPDAQRFNAAVPSELISICRKAMAKSKADRYQTPEAIANDIESWLVHGKVSAHDYAVIDRVFRWTRQHIALASVLTISSILIATISIGSSLSLANAKRKTDTALAKMRAEKSARLLDLLNVYVSAPPNQAEVFLQELNSYSSDDLQVLFDSLEIPQAPVALAHRLKLIRLDERPTALLPILQALPDENVEEISLLVSAIQMPTEYVNAGLVDNIMELANSRETILVAAALLAKLLPQGECWEEIATRVANRLVEVDDRNVQSWSHLLKPAKSALRLPLLQMYASDTPSLSRERIAAGEILVDFFASEPQQLVGMLGTAKGSVFGNLMSILKTDPGRSRTALQSLLRDGSPPEPFAGKSSLKQLVVDSQGMINSRFAICRALPAEYFEQVVANMREEGFRPIQIERFEKATNHYFASVWNRDKKPFVVESALPGSKLESTIQAKREQGWVPTYLSCNDRSPSARFTLVFHKDLEDQSDYRVLCDNDLNDHKLNSSVLGQNGFQQLSYVEYLDTNERLQVAGLYRKNRFVRDSSSKAALVSNIDHPDVRRLAEHVPVFLRSGPRGITGVWHQNKDVVGVVDVATEGREQLGNWTRLAEKSFYPVAISTQSRGGLDNLADPGFTIWHRRIHTTESLVNYGVALCLLGDDSLVLKLLRRNPDATARTALIHRIPNEPIAIERLLKWLSQTRLAGVKSAVVQILGELKRGGRGAKNAREIVSAIKQVYETNQDPGVRGAAIWSLRQWGEQVEVRETELRDDGQQFVDAEGNTMVVVDAPLEFHMGTRLEPPLHAAVERYHIRRIKRRFAISTREVTWRQFSRFSKVMPAGFTRFYSKTADGRLNQEAPQYQISWYRAAEYCNWLSLQAGLPESEWCYAPNEEGEFGPGLIVPEDFLDRTGYRLPTEAEWEYAARAGSMTECFFGDDPRMLSEYAWHKGNSGISTHGVGMLKPNEFGLFDVYGNVWEWCHGSRDDEWPGYFETAEDAVSPLPAVDRHPRILRGGSMVNTSGLLRSSIRSFNRPSNEQFTIGFRVVRTLPEREPMHPGDD